MSITKRQYAGENDYWKIDRFLIDHYLPDNRDGNWIEPAWEYMHAHPLLNWDALPKIGIWEDDNIPVAVAHYEWHLGEAFFQFHPAYKHLQKEMLDYAEEHLWGVSSRNGKRYLKAFVIDSDLALQNLVKERGYTRDPDEDRPMAIFRIPEPFPEISLPEGFCLTSLADEPDWTKVHQVLWRGFDHGDDPPMNEEEFESRRKMFSTPTARLDLKIAAQAPNGEFAAFCGMFYEPTHLYAYVEPVATDPRYRRMGLGKAAVLEGIRRCSELGATVAYVGSDQPFYLALGFEVIYTSECWVKYL
jgi:GNAT superfamily N-acetyltransferase